MDKKQNNHYPNYWQLKVKANGYDIFIFKIEYLKFH